MVHLLAPEIDILQYPVVSIPASTMLHHFGTYDAAKNSLDRPMWVSDLLSAAARYKNFGTPPRYSTFVTIGSVELRDLNGFRLQPIANKLGLKSHYDWNELLASFLSGTKVQGIVYAEREIFIANPAMHFGSAASCAC